MLEILNKINEPKDLKGLSKEELEKLSEEIREILLKKLKMIYPTIHFHIIVNNLEYIENLLLLTLTFFSFSNIIWRLFSFTSL